MTPLPGWRPMNALSPVFVVVPVNAKSPAFPWCKIAGLFAVRDRRLFKLLLNAHAFAPHDPGLRHLLIGGGRILGTSEQRADLSRLNVAVTDLEGLRPSPGFIDGPAHVAGGGGESRFGRFENQSDNGSSP